MEPVTGTWDRISIGIPGAEFEPRPPRAFGVARSDSECDGWSTPAITLRSASVRGDKHRYYREPRQDAVCSSAHVDSGAVVFAVADGVSSAEAAEIGAVDACHAAVQALRSQLDHDPAFVDCDAIVAYVAKTLLWRAQLLLKTPSPAEPGRAERLLGTTLTAGVAWPGRDGLRLQLLQVGDSGAWQLDLASGRYLRLLGTADDLVSTEVTALPRVPSPATQLTTTVSPGQVLLVGTDGFGVPLGDGDGQVGALLARNLASPPSPLRLAYLLDFSRETFDDDRTLLALWPRRAGETW